MLIIAYPTPPHHYPRSLSVRSWPHHRISAAPASLSALPFRSQLATSSHIRHPRITIRAPFPFTVGHIIAYPPPPHRYPRSLSVRSWPHHRISAAPASLSTLSFRSQLASSSHIRRPRIAIHALFPFAV